MRTSKNINFRVVYCLLRVIEPYINPFKIILITAGNIVFCADRIVLCVPVQPQAGQVTTSCFCLPKGGLAARTSLPCHSSSSISSSILRWSRFFRPWFASPMGEKKGKRQNRKKNRWEKREREPKGERRAQNGWGPVPRPGSLYLGLVLTPPPCAPPPNTNRGFLSFHATQPTRGRRRGGRGGGRGRRVHARAHMWHTFTCLGERPRVRERKRKHGSWN